MQKKAKIDCLQKILERYIPKFLGSEKDITVKLSEWIVVETYHPLALLVRNYGTVVDTHITVLHTILRHEKIKVNEITTATGMEAMFTEIDEKMPCCSNKQTRDAFFIAALQTLIHLKINWYGTAAAFALTLDLKDLATDFHALCEDEQYYDKQLSHMAKHSINTKAIIY